MNCPICSHTTTRHFEHQEIYWFCTHCWQTVPNYEQSLLIYKKSCSVQFLSTWAQRRSYTKQMQYRTAMSDRNTETLEPVA